MLYDPTPWPLPKEGGKLRKIGVFAAFGRKNTNFPVIINKGTA
jgi:hypothetical protein